MVSEWRSAIAVSLNVGGCVRLVKPAKLYLHTHKKKQHVPGNVVTTTECIHRQNRPTNTISYNTDTVCSWLTVLSTLFFLNITSRPQTSRSPPVILLLAVPRRLFCFGSLMVLDVVFRYLSLLLLYINIKIGKIGC